MTDASGTQVGGTGSDWSTDRSLVPGGEGRWVTPGRSAGRQIRDRPVDGTGRNCDTEVTVDEWIDIVQLANYRIAGYGGSDMSPAMVRLRNDPEVSAVVVITDGFINYPEQMEGCEVLWAITDNGKFNQPYGTVLHLRRGRRT